MKTMLCAFVLAATAAASFAQASQVVWSRTYGYPELSEKCHHACQVSDSGFVLGGSVNNGAITRPWIVRTDAEGDTLWTRILSAPEGEVYALAATRDSGCIAAGWVQSGQGSKGWIEKIDAGGQSEWYQTYGHTSNEGLWDNFRAVQQTPEGGYIAAGQLQLNITGLTGMWLVRMDSTGDSLWSRTYGRNWEYCADLVQTTGGGFLLAGGTWGYGIGTPDSSNYWIVKTNSSGDSLWSRVFGGSGDDWCNSIDPAADGSYILAGRSDSYDVGNGDAWLIKINSSGDSLWTGILGGGGWEAYRDVQEVPEGGFVAAGVTWSFGEGSPDQSNLLMAKTNASGNILWYTALSGMGWAEGEFVQLTGDGGYVLAGWTSSGESATADFWLVKLRTDTSEGIHDDFNDNSLDSTRWIAYSSTCASITEVNERLEIVFSNTCSGGFSAGVNSTWQFQGDFDFQADYTLVNWPPDNGIRVGLGPGGVQRGNRWTYPEYYATDMCDGASGYATTDMAGKLRLARIGTQLYGYRWSAAGWVLIHSASCDYGIISIGLTCWGHDYSSGATIAFDNFRINAGTIVYPSIEIISPNGGEVWPVGSVQTISWTSAYVTGDVRIAMNREYPIGNWEVLTPGATNTGFFEWTVTGPPASAIRISIRSVADASVRDGSDADFTITDTSLNVTWLGSYDTPGAADDVALSGDYAYVADRGYGLRIIDVTDPFEPVEVGFYDTPGYAWSVALSGSYAYIAERIGGLRIIDITNPAAPVEVGFYDMADQLRDVVVRENYAYVADFDQGLRIIDVVNPAAPFEVGFYDTPGWAYGVAVSENFAYMADSVSGLRVVDITNVATPFEVGYYDTPGNARSVTVIGSYAYVADEVSGLRIIDISDPAFPSEVGFYDTPGSAEEVVVSGIHAYVADYASGMRIIDVGDPTFPTEVGYYDTPGLSRGVAIRNDVAYVADWSNGLELYDVSYFYSPSTITVLTPNGGESWTMGSTKEIAWTSANLLGNVQIALNRNYPTGDWVRLATVAVNSETYNWTVTGPATDSSRISIRSAHEQTIRDISDDDFTIRGTNVCGDVTGVWDLAGSPYCVTCDMRIPAGQALEIQPGVQVLFQGYYKFLVDTGAVLRAIGTADDTIRFDEHPGFAGTRWKGIRFNYASDSSRLEYCHITHGFATGGEDNGGGIFCSNANPIISHCLVDHCTSSGGGGGIGCYFASPIITNNTIVSNTSSASDGGGINCFSSNPTISNNLIRWNAASSSGGGIACVANSAPLISGNTISGNSTNSYIGGGVYSYGSSPRILNNTISENYAQWDGGGVHFDGYSNGQLDGNIISRNTTAWGGGGVVCGYYSSPDIIRNVVELNTGSQRGGGIVCWNNSSPLIRANIIRHNSTPGNGGGISCDGGASNPLIDSCVIAANTASQSGGGVYCENSSPTIQNCLIDSCTAGSNGGGIYCENSSPTILGDTLRGNTGNGFGESGGGAIYLTGQSNATITNCTVISNTAPNGCGGAVRSQNSSPHFVNSNFSGNSCRGHGGCMRFWGGSPVFENCTISNNWSWGWADYTFGGGLSFAQTSPTLELCTISGNSIYGSWGGHGGGLNISEGSTVAFTECVIGGNSATRHGGGVHCSNSTLSLLGCTINTNVAGSTGGGIYLTYSNATIENCAIDSCRANNGEGGGIYSEYSSPVIQDNQIRGNLATGNGGGVRFAGNSTPTIHRCLIEGNSSTGSHGGGICTGSYAQPSIVENRIRWNTAAGTGGGIVSWALPTTRFELNEITHNTAGSLGGGVFLNWFSDTLNKNTIACNHAAQGGGAYFDGSSPLVVNCILWANTPDMVFQNATSNAVINYSCLQDQWPGEGNHNYCDPLFVDSCHDVHLLPGSPAIDTGHPDPSYNDPDGSRADMGCYYSHSLLAVTSPTGGEMWLIGDARNITWTGQSQASTVNIEVNRDYPVGQWEFIAPGIPNSGSHSWIVTGPPTTTARMRVLSVENPSIGDTSNAEFTIERNRPRLSWAGGTGYSYDGVEPDVGGIDAPFEFRAKYRDALGSAPLDSTYPRLRIDTNLDDVPEYDVPMYALDTSQYVAGRTYSRTLFLPQATTLRYSFFALNATGDSSVMDPAVVSWTAGPQVLQTDLAVYADDILFSDQNPDTGSRFTVTARIHNNSFASAAQVRVRFYAKPDNYWSESRTGDYQLFGERVIYSIPPWEYAEVRMDTSYAVSGFYPFKVRVDESNEIPEWNELNNEAIRPITVGNFSVPGAIAMTSAVATGCRTATVYGNAHYIGAVLTGEVVAGARVRITIDGGDFEDTYTNANGVYSRTFSLSPGNHFVTLTLTDFTLSDSSSNTFSVPDCPVPPAGGGGSCVSPHDVAISLTVSQPTVAHEVTISGTIRNPGTVSETGVPWKVTVDNVDFISGTVNLGPEAESPFGPANITLSPTIAHTISAIADPSNQVFECNEGNNIVHRYLFPRDLTVDYANIGVTTTAAAPGAANSFHATVRNPGDFYFPAGETQCQFQLSNAVFGTQNMPAVAPRSNVLVTIPWTTSYAADMLKVIADPYNNAVEANEFNNQDSILLPLDLYLGRPSDFPLQVNVGNSVRIPVRVFNPGAMDAVNAQIAFHQTERATGDTATIAVNQVTVPHHRRTPWDAAYTYAEQSYALPGWVVFRITADPANLLPEYREDNNVLVDSFFVGLAAPDLQILSQHIHISDLNPDIGEAVQVTATVFNIGVGPTTDSAAVVFGMDADRLGDTVRIPPLTTWQGGFSYYTIQAATPWIALNPDSAYLHTASVRVDADSQITELNELNNYATRSIIVGAAPDLVVETAGIQFSPQYPHPADSITITITVRNIGGAQGTGVLHITCPPLAFAARDSIAIPPFGQPTTRNFRMFISDIGMWSVPVQARIDSVIPYEMQQGNNLAVRDLQLARPVVFPLHEALNFQFVDPLDSALLVLPIANTGYDSTLLVDSVIVTDPHYRIALEPQYAVRLPGGTGRSALDEDIAFTLAVGQVRNLNVIFSPTELASYPAQIRIYSNDPVNPQRPVSLSGIGQGPIFYAENLPAEIDYGVIPINAPMAYEIAITNSWYGTLQLALSLAAGDSNFFVHPAGGSLIHGQVLTTYIWFMPDTFGTFRDTLRITTNAYNAPLLQIPLVGSDTMFVIDGFRAILEGEDIRLRWASIRTAWGNELPMISAYNLYHCGEVDGTYELLTTFGTSDSTFLHVAPEPIEQHFYYMTYLADGFRNAIVNAGSVPDACIQGRITITMSSEQCTGWKQTR